MNNYRKIALLSFSMVVACATYAQDGAKAKDITTTRLNSTTVLTIEKKDVSFSSEKKVNGITIQVYTQEQFNKLPKERKEYYKSHPNSYEIINQKDN